MRNKRVISTIAVILVLLMVLSLVAGALTNAFADSEAELAELKAERDELVRQMFAQQAVVDELESKHSDVVERKLAMDERNESCRQQIALLEQEIAVYEDLIEQKSIELDTAMDREAEQLEKYRIRVRAMEESGSLSILSIFFGSENLPQLLAAVDDMREIMEQDRRLEEELIAAREAVELAKSELMTYKLAMEEDRSALSEEKALLDRQIAEADTFIAEILNSIDTESELYQAIRMSERAVETQIANMIIALDRKRAAEEAQRQQAMQSVSSGGTVSVGGGQQAQQSSTPAVVGSGNFAWPTGCTYITSVVGNRYHPVSGQWKYHAGMDIGAQYGDTISASDSGMVSLAGVNGGYGNCVIIDHGNGYYTLYGHMSSIAVSEGQSVSKGQTIGYVGSTGVSTGPHLHFEIRNSGGAIDFNGWFGGLSYAPDAGDPNS